MKVLNHSIVRGSLIKGGIVQGGAVMPLGILYSIYNAAKGGL